MKYAIRAMVLLVLLAGCDSVSPGEHMTNDSAALEQTRQEMLAQGVDAQMVNAVVGHLSTVEGLRSVNFVYADPKEETDKPANKLMTTWEYDTGSLSTPLCCGVYRFRIDLDGATIQTNAYTQGNPTNPDHDYGTPNYARTAIYAGSGYQLDVASEEHWIRAEVDASSSKYSYTSFCAVSDHYMPDGSGGQIFIDAFTYCWDE